MKVSPGTLYSLLASPTRESEWRSEPDDAPEPRRLVSVQRTDGDDDRVGSVYRRQTHSGTGVDTEETLTLTTLEAERLVVLEGPWSNGTARTEYHLEPVGQETEVTLRQEFSSSGLRERLLGSLLMRPGMIRRIQQTDLSRLESAAAGGRS